jgi:hypothetical protein
LAAGYVILYYTECETMLVFLLTNTTFAGTFANWALINSHNLGFNPNLSARYKPN